MYFVILWFDRSDWDSGDHSFTFSSVTGLPSDLLKGTSSIFVSFPSLKIGLVGIIYLFFFFNLYFFKPL